MKNILLTGATGFLGSALARHWIRSGYKVSALTRPTTNTVRIQDLLDGIQLICCNGDEDVLGAVAKVAPDYIVHTACSYGRAGESLVEIFDVNVRLGLLLMEGAKLLEKEVFFVNTGTILDPTVSNYAMSKQCFSALGAQQARQIGSGIKFINISLQHMYGPGDDKSKFTTHVISSCLENKENLKLTSGTQKRDFIFISDVVSAYDAILSNVGSIADFEDVEVGSGEAVYVRKFVELVHSLTASKTILEFGAIPYRINEAMLFEADISRMRSFGWVPSISLEEGIKMTVNKDSSR
jgi:nucleoside-diphosphate-sugar epimerase